MGIDIIKMNKPVWTRKLSNQKLQQYLDALNEWELTDRTTNELLLNTVAMYYHAPTTIDTLMMHLALDVYKEAAVRWYEEQQHSQ